MFLFIGFTYRKSWFFFHYFIFLFFIFPDKLPNGVTYHTGTYQDRLTKLQDNLRQLSVLFRKLRLVYDKCNENCGGMDPIPVEVIFCDRGRMNIRCELVSRQLLLFCLSLLAIFPGFEFYWFYFWPQKMKMWYICIKYYYIFTLIISCRLWQACSNFCC